MVHLETAAVVERIEFVGIINDLNIKQTSNIQQCHTNDNSRKQYSSVAQVHRYRLNTKYSLKTITNTVRTIFISILKNKNPKSSNVNVKHRYKVI